MLKQSDFDDSVENLGWRFSCNLKEKCHPIFDNKKNAENIYKILVKDEIIDRSKVLDHESIENWFDITFKTYYDLADFIYKLTVYVEQKKESFLAVSYSIKLPNGHSRTI